MVDGTLSIRYDRVGSTNTPCCSDPKPSLSVVEMNARGNVEHSESEEDIVDHSKSID